MSIKNLFESGEQLSKSTHFTAIVHLAAVDGQINLEEKKVLEKLALKLDIGHEEYNEILSWAADVQESPEYKTKKRLEYIHDLFQIIYADHDINEVEQKILRKYAIQLGFTEKEAAKIIQKSIKIFGGKIDFEDYELIMNQ
ncbi:TerB family tellurite resistance protein [Flavobacteriaceae bacterium TP-CH-4]|uniref:TerB family tellurite resistance protein n=1 Tax=Pelagihabitans pacificus TaxID=2696054 RepID=A0A967AQK0_9FLAO|nr:TerB family tellurite resistance protein [Pelagihabitans pacificus]NHF58508.1 TerB family tellurite resistance protein [Pelagihabitans pacificus]